MGCAGLACCTVRGYSIRDGKPDQFGPVFDPDPPPGRGGPIQLSPSHAQRFFPVKIGNPMTTEQVDLIEAGPDMDAAVAVAIGGYTIPYRMPDGRDVRALCYDGMMQVAPWNPSRSWTDAMFAAERFGLFNSFRVLRMNRYDWEVMEIGDPLDRIVSNAPSGPLAICRAILKLHGGAV